MGGDFVFLKIPTSNQADTGGDFHFLQYKINVQLVLRMTEILITTRI